MGDIETPGALMLGGSVQGDGHVRGIDVFTVQDGKVTEKIAYVKG